MLKFCGWTLVISINEKWILTVRPNYVLLQAYINFQLIYKPLSLSLCNIIFKEMVISTAAVDRVAFTQLASTAVIDQS